MAHADGWSMRLVSGSVPRQPRLSAITADEVALEPLSEESRFVMRGSNLFSGNGWAIFRGIALGVLLVCAAAQLINKNQRAHGREALSWTKFVRARTHSVSASPHQLITPAPVVVQLDANLIHVSAIALGHPRLAVVNGQSVTEGDYVKVRSANPAVSISLRVLKIADRRIDLTDGRQTITTRLALPGLERTKTD
jgi:hypothetical protein